MLNLSDLGPRRGQICSLMILWEKGKTMDISETIVVYDVECFFRNLILCVEVLRPCQQLRSCEANQLPINAIPGQAYTY